MFGRVSLFLWALLASSVLGAVSIPPWKKGLEVRSYTPRRSSAPNRLVGRSDGYKGVIKPKLFILSLFTPEGAVWPGPLKLYANNVTVPGFAPLFPTAHCNKEGSICQAITGEGEINAAATIGALVTSNLFDLSTTYFFVAGIAGINPACGTLGSASFARYAVQVGLEYEIDSRELADNYTAPHIPLGAKAPLEYPVFLYGTEVFEVNVALRDRAVKLASTAKLNDTKSAQDYRKKYRNAPANKPPSVIKGDVATSDAFHGQLLGEYFGNYVSLLSNGTGKYCTTAQEDNAIAEALLRGAISKRVDFGRVILMRTAANFDRPPPGITASQELLYINQGGFGISLENIYLAGRPIVDDIIKNWDSVYKKGIKPTNYIGDIFESLKGPIKPDIGSPFFQEG